MTAYLEKNTNTPKCMCLACCITARCPDASALINMDNICVNNTFQVNRGYVDERAGGGCSQT